MPESLQALLSQIIDYAGVFPPEQLALDEALANYVGYSNSADAWMLSSLVVPASRLADLGKRIKRGTFELDQLPLSVVVTGQREALQWQASFEDDLAAIGGICAAHAHRVEIRGLELRVPQRLAAAPDAARVRELLRRTEASLASARIACPMVYWEVPVSDLGKRAWRQSVEQMLSAIRQRDSAELSHRLKLRCGGATAAEIPSAGDVAWFAAVCCDAQVPWKATAGLHHAVRKIQPDGHAATHGFLNLLTAAVLAECRGLDEPAIEEILTDQDLSQFKFTDEHCGYQDDMASVDEIRAARQRAMVSLGSCSFDEPREDLRAMGLSTPGQVV